MSLFRYLFDSDWMQRADLERLDEKAEKLEARVWADREKKVGLELQVNELRRDVGRMLLMLETTQRILADKGICSSEDFVRRMRAIDAEDGIEDGQLRPPAPTESELRYCDACQHFNPARLKSCQYCGRLFGRKDAR